MSETDIILLQRWGPWFVMAFMILRDLLPFLRDKLFPQMMDERKEENERRWLWSERQVKSQEAIAEGVQAIKVFLATLDARSEVSALGIQRIEILMTEINTRTRSQEQKTVPIRPSEKKSRRL